MTKDLISLLEERLSKLFDASGQIVDVLTPLHSKYPSLFSKDPFGAEP